MDKLEVTLSFITHEQLSLTSANPHPLFDNFFYGYNNEYLSFFVPLKDLCHSIHIPAWLCPTFDPDPSLYKRLKDAKASKSSTVNRLPNYRESIFKIKIRPAEDLCSFDNIVPSIHLHNGMINIGSTVCTYIFIVPCTDSILTITSNNDAVLPNYEMIKVWSEIADVRNTVHLHDTGNIIAGNAAFARSA
jgi:hypothetical protein